MTMRDLIKANAMLAGFPFVSIVPPSIIMTVDEIHTPRRVCSNLWRN